MTAKASARKSLGAYKPIIEYPAGSPNKTEVLEQSVDRFDRNTRTGMVKGDKFARGNTYLTREEAVAAAQAVIDARLAGARDRLARCPERSRHHVLREVALWGG